MKINAEMDCPCAQLRENGGVPFPEAYKGFNRFYFAHKGLDESVSFYWCPVCESLWDELDSPVMFEGDKAFDEMQWEEVVKKIGEELPEDFPADYAHFVRWINKGGECNHLMFQGVLFAGPHPSEC